MVRYTFVSTLSIYSQVTRSTFVIELGEPAQPLRLLPSTSLLETYVIDSGVGCPSSTKNLTFYTSEGVSGQPCSESRGKLYDLNEDKAARNFGSNTSSPDTSRTVYSIDEYAALRSYGADFQAYGFTSDLSFGFLSQPRELIKVPVYNFADWNYTWVGLLGMRGNPSYQQPNGTASRLMTNTLLHSMRSKRLIPRLSWGYTAGSFNRNIFGSLVLGGVDTNRYIPNDVKFKFSQDEERPLLVNLANIQMNIPGNIKEQSGSGSNLLVPHSSTTILTENDRDPEHKYPVTLGNQTMMTVDSNLPYMYLPPAFCDHIASSLNLTLDQESNRYLISDSVHDKLLSQGMNLNFTFDSHQPHGKLVSIVVEYHSLHLYDGRPFGTGGRYFPIRKGAPNNYQLGRAFFQDAYVIADYEDQKFSLHQVDYTRSPKDTNIVPHALSLEFPSDPVKKLSSLAIAGIVTGSVFFALILVLIGICHRAKISIRMENAKAQELSAKEMTTTDTVGGESTISPTLDVASPSEAPLTQVAEADGNPLPPPVELPNDDIQEMPDDSGNLSAHYKRAELDATTPVFEMEGPPIPKGWSDSLYANSSPPSSENTTPSPPSTNIAPAGTLPGSEESTSNISSEKKDTLLPLPKIVPVVPRNSAAIRDRMNGVETNLTPPSPIPQTPLEFYGGVMPEIRWKQAQRKAVEKGIERERVRREERFQAARDGTVPKDGVAEREQERMSLFPLPSRHEIEEDLEDGPSPEDEPLPAYADLHPGPKISPLEEQESTVQETFDEKAQVKEQEQQKRPTLTVTPPASSSMRPEYLTPSSPIPQTPARFYHKNSEAGPSSAVPTIEEDEESGTQSLYSATNPVLFKNMGSKKGKERSTE